MAYDVFHVPRSMHWFSGFVHHTPGLWRWLGNVESLSLGQQLRSIEIRQPCFIAGLARSGSTLLLEIIASHVSVATHRYRDFPLIDTPCWWNRFLDLAARGGTEPAERAHGDGLLVTPQSPEAMEEMLWMRFFPDLHDPSQSNVLDRRSKNPAFEQFFQDHLRKLLLIRGGTRYASKGNYNLTRLEYLQEQFPDARIVLALRRPRDHVASLRKTHALFCQAAAAQPRSLAHLQRTGHFEFGRDRRAINAGDDEVVRSVAELWKAGEEVRGWARYWAHLYGHVAERLGADTALREASMVVRHEDLCADTEARIRRLMQHCQLAPVEEVVDRYRDAVQLPTYYEAAFTAAEEAAIEEETQAVAALFGYESETLLADYPLVS